MLHRVTLWNTARPGLRPSRTGMPIEIEGAVYFSADEVIDTLGVSRQTLWRWRRKGVVPSGRRFRDRQIVFTPHEFQQVREYANRVEPLDVGAREQLKLFNGAA